ncbi:phosphonate C-P lyase system protein PhnH [Marinobacterium maritimum]|uniref:Phosphonate C-P lyase system protein PhnH n=1 Tax=Marinobacterium maritimum TaxID=500162 RepID=A0ABP3TB31_9GAMM
MAVSSNELIAGFADPVQASQQVFRAALKAMSEPGTLMQIDYVEQAPKGLDLSTWQLALSLLDPDTPVWLSPALASSDAVISNLRFHCQCPLVDNPSDADFAIALHSELPLLAELNWGTAEYPDRSTTLMVQVPALSEEAHWTLSGPGIEHTRTLRIAGLSEPFRSDLIRSRQRFPLGIDTFWCCDNRLTALPRTTSIQPCANQQQETC